MRKKYSTVFIIVVLVLVGLMTLLPFTLFKEKVTPTSPKPTQKQQKTVENRGVLAKDETADQRRLTDLQKIVEALEAYKADNNYYPKSTGLCKWGWDGDNHPAFLFILEKKGYIDSIPRDPEGINNDYCETMYGGKHYLYYSDGEKFALLALMSEPQDDINMPLVSGDLAWFDGTFVKRAWNWDKNLYIIKQP